MDNFDVFIGGPIEELARLQYEFMEVMGQTNLPKLQGDTLWCDLLQEELNEVFREKPGSAEQCHELADLLYVLLGLANHHGYVSELQALFDCIHEANMKKVDPETGKVKKNMYGKVLKPEGWQPVDTQKVFDNV